MSRAVNVFRRSDTGAHHLDDILSEEAPEEQDTAALRTTPESEVLICQQYVVLSSTFRVPAFYFLVCNASESNLAADLASHLSSQAELHFPFQRF
jgi:ubiquitin-like-conjugating enzyme ATG10